MPCYHPIAAIQRKAGSPLFFNVDPVPGDRKLEVPCGQCIGCRLEKSRQFGLRCMHEAKMHEENSFLTLTYRDEDLPTDLQLVPKHWDLFKKRVAEDIRRNKGKPFRYMMCGEYGDELGRPHYHAVMFGYNPKDRIFFKNSGSGFPIYTSKYLDDKWEKGNVFIGDVSFESACYVARYTMKKVGKDKDREILDVFTGEIIKRRQEFGRMSTKPGLGAKFVETFPEDIYTHDRVLVNGHYAPLPRYYDKLLERVSPLLLAEFKAARIERGEEKAERIRELHPELSIKNYTALPVPAMYSDASIIFKRMVTEEVVKKEKVKLLKRRN